MGWPLSFSSLRQQRGNHRQIEKIVLLLPCHVAFSASLALSGLGQAIRAEVLSLGWSSLGIPNLCYAQFTPLQVGVARQEPEGVFWLWKECEGRRPSGWGPRAGQRAEGSMRSCSLGLLVQHLCG